MSTGCSLTPGVRVQLKPSSRLALLGSAWRGVAVIAGVCLVTRGHTLVAVALLTGWVFVDARQSRQRGHLQALHWSPRGGWHCDTGSGPRPVRLLPGCLCLPGALYLRWQLHPEGAPCAAWLLEDSCDALQWRRLRQALRLQG